MSIKLDSLLIHGGVDGDEKTGAVAVPVYQTSTYKQDGLGKTRGWEYSRTGNPTRDALEKLIAELEQGEYGFAFASGLAAINTVLSLFKTDDKLIVSDNIYGGTFRILENVFKNFGIRYEMVNTADIPSVERAITDDVRAIYVESPANPLLTVTDIKAVSEIAHKHGKLLIVDNTFLTPYLQRPLTLGADIVVHSGTKYLGGHSDTVSGLAAVKDKSIADRLYYLQNAIGGVLAPWDSFLVLRGIKTLGVRMERHVKNAQKIARWLESSGFADRVYYPGLESDPGYEIQNRQADVGGVQRGVESLVCHPASMTHAAISPEIRRKVGILDELIRLSVGIESADDLIQDIEQAVKASEKEAP